MKRLPLLLILSVLALPIHAAEESGKISKIEHSGLEQTDRRAVECRLGNKEGCEYSEELWEEEKNALMDLDIFADVQVRKEVIDGSTVLTYSYRELPAFIVFPAMKRTDQDGLLIGPGVTFMNLGGFGIHQEILSRYTVAPEPLRAKEVLTYTRIPRIMDIPFSTEITLSYFESYNALKLYQENSYYGQAELFYRLTKVFSIKTAASAFYVRHDNDNPWFTESHEDMRMFYGSGGWDYLPSLGAGLVIDTRERIMNPHRGFYNEFRGSIHGEKLGGDSDYSELVYDFRGYLPLGNKHIFHMNFLGRFRPGTIPAYELYHIGGVNSIRAYEPDASMCGQHEALGTLEYRYELFTHRQVSLLDLNGYYGLQLVAGTDHAVNWMKHDSPGNGTYYNSFFAGVHLLVPVLERVRFEFGFSGFENDRYNVRFGANMGWYEKAATQNNRVR